MTEYCRKMRLMKGAAQILGVSDHLTVCYTKMVSVRCTFSWSELCV